MNRLKVAIPITLPGAEPVVHDRTLYRHKAGTEQPRLVHQVKGSSVAFARPGFEPVWYTKEEVLRDWEPYSPSSQTKLRPIPLKVGAWEIEERGSHKLNVAPIYLAETLVAHLYYYPKHKNCFWVVTFPAHSHRFTQYILTKTGRPRGTPDVYRALEWLYDGIMDSTAEMRAWFEAVR